MRLLRLLYLRVGRTSALSVLALAILTAPVAAVVPYGLPNVLGTKTANNRAVYAAIQTSNPTTRGTWIYHRVLARRIQSGYPETYVESGWIKNVGAGNYPRIYWVTNDLNNNRGGGYDDRFGAPGIGVIYNYEVRRTGSKTWSAYYTNNQLGSDWVGWDTMWEWASGGEANDTNQGMGDSTHNNVQSLGTDGVWYSACGYEVYNPHWQIWTLWGGANCSSWRIFGNN